jgi:DNA-binding NtrC family response regulator
VTLPALREGPDDVLVLAGAFLEEIGRNIGHSPSGLSKDAKSPPGASLAPEHPGAPNAIERAMILGGGGLITGEHLPITLAGAARAAAPAASPAPAASQSSARSRFEPHAVYTLLRRFGLD